MHPLLKLNSFQIRACLVRCSVFFFSQKRKRFAVGSIFFFLQNQNKLRLKLGVFPITKCGVPVACQLLGSVALRKFGISPPQEISYKCASCDGDVSVFTDAAKDQQQAFHREIK